MTVSSFEKLEGRFLPGVTAAADYSALSPRGHYAVTLATTGSNAIGFITNNPGSGRVADVALEGNIVRAVAGGTIAQGDKVAAFTGGKVQVAATGNHVIGRALAAAVSGDVFPVLVTLGGAPLP